jgi:hypothetical protein
MTALDGVKGTVCNEQQYNQSLELNVAPSISCLTHGESIGLAVGIWSTSLRLELIQFTVNGRSVVH